MPLQNGVYVSPTFVNDSSPALSADEMNAMAGAVQGAVEYDREMELSEAQKNQAAGNIGALRNAAQALTLEEQAQILANIGGLSYNAQSLSSAQKLQAAANIGALMTDAAQSLSAAQKSQARSNLGAFSAWGEAISVPYASWNGSSAPYTATVSVSGATAYNLIVVGIASNATAEQYQAFSDGQIICSGQSNGSITLKAFGDKPNTALPISVLIIS